MNFKLDNLAVLPSSGHEMHLIKKAFKCLYNCILFTENTLFGISSHYMSTTVGTMYYLADSHTFKVNLQYNVQMFSFTATWFGLGMFQMHDEKVNNEAENKLNFSINRVM